MTARPLAGPRRPSALARVLALAREQHDRGAADDATFLYREALDVEPADDELRAALDDLCDRSTPRAPVHVPPRTLSQRITRRFVRAHVQALVQRPRVLKYRALSTCTRVTGRPVALQPVLFVGAGEILLGNEVQFGWNASPLFYTGYCYVEASHMESRIELSDRVEFNNNAMLKSEGPGIRVGRDALFGAHVEIFDSDFHDLDPRQRRTGKPQMAPVEIGANVFVGMSVKILKGVTIGADSVIGAGAIVTRSIPAGVLAAGNPARVIREL